MTYSEHREKQKQYERDQWMAAGPEERAARWAMRQVYLREHYQHLWEKLPEHLVLTPGCEFCGAVRPYGGHWPSYWLCYNCGTRFVIDAFSHLCQTEVEQVCKI